MQTEVVRGTHTILRNYLLLPQTVSALAATPPTEEEIIFQRSQHFFDELEGFQWRAPEWPAARRIVSRGVSHWSCAEWPDPTGYWPAEIRESSVVLGPAKRDRLRFRRLQQARETFRAMIRCLHQDDSGGQVCGRQTESFRRPNYREHTALRNSSWPHRTSQGPHQLQPASELPLKACAVRTGADQFSPQGPAFAGSVLPSTEWRRKLGCAY